MVSIRRNLRKLRMLLFTLFRRNLRNKALIDEKPLCRILHRGQKSQTLSNIWLKHYHEWICSLRRILRREVLTKIFMLASVVYAAGVFTFVFIASDQIM